MRRRFLDWIKGLFNKGCKKKLNKKDIIRNIRELEEARSKLQKGTEQYNAIQAEIAKEYDILKKFNDARFPIKLEVFVMPLVIAGIYIFAISLDRDNPTALKLAQVICKIPNAKLTA